MAFDARDHLGVNVHSAASAYSDVGQFENFLAYLGVKWVRDDNPNGASLLSGYNVQFVNTAADSATAVAQTNTAIAGGAKAVELLNEPPTVPIMFGSSIGGNSGALTLAAEQTKFGKLPVVRSFSSGFPSNIPAGLDSSQIWHHSFKGVGTNYTAMSAGTWDAQIRTWLQGLPSWLNLLFTYYHEPENNWPSGAAYAAAQTHFYNLVRTCPNVKANVKVAPVFTAYILSHGKGSVPGGTSAYDLTNFWPSGPAPDYVGFDFDGVTNTSSYFNWSSIGYMGWADTFAQSKGIPYIVPEFAGNALSNGSDSSHTGRTAYIQAQAAAFTASPSCAWVTWWDDSSSVLTTSNETTAWKNLVAQSAPMIAAQQTNLAVVGAVNGRVPVVGSALPDGIATRNAILWGAVQGQKGLSEGNVHLYRGNRNSTDWTTRRTAGYALLPYTAKGLTYQVTETGYHDYTGAVNHGQSPTLDSDAATEIVPDVQQLIADGATKVFLYEAIDEDLAFPADSEGYFGLAQDDWTPKPQAAAVQAYLGGFVVTPTAPLAPTNVIAMAGDAIANVTWTVSTAGTPADTYLVTPAPLDQPAQTVIAPTQVAVFAGLTNGTTYTFTVVAVNSQGSSTGVTSNAVTPVLTSTGGGGGGTGIPATGGGGIGSIAPIVKTPFPASYPTPLASIAPQVQGQVQQAFFYDPNTADLLQITPNQTGIWINDLDVGYPVVREVTQSNPGRNGEYDQTQFFGGRAITLSLTVRQAADMTGTMQPAGYWLEVLRAWVADPSNRFRFGFQLSGQRQRFANVRASDASAPFIGSGLGRTSISVQLTLRSPDGLLYEQNPLPNDLAVLQNGLLVGDGRFESIIPQAVAGSGITFPVTFPVTFPAQSTGTINVPYRGTARSSPEIRIVGACTDPSISALNPDGTVRGQLSFTGLTLAGTDELRLDLGAKTAIRLASGAVQSNVRQYLTSWSWFDLLPDSTGTLNRLKFTVGSGTATAKVYYLNAFV